MRRRKQEPDLAGEGRGDGGRGTRESRWRIQVDQTDRKAGSRDGRQKRRAGEGGRADPSDRLEARSRYRTQATPSTEKIPHSDNASRLFI